MLLRTIIICAILLLPLGASAHFGLLYPSDDIVATEEEKRITLSAKFLHPMEMTMMDMARPVRVGVVHRGKTTDLLGDFTESKEDGMRWWVGSHTLTRPGDYLYFMEPAPYWEPMEESFIAAVRQSGMMSSPHSLTTRGIS